MFIIISQKHRSVHAALAILFCSIYPPQSCRSCLLISLRKKIIQISLTLVQPYRTCAKARLRSNSCRKRTGSKAMYSIEKKKKKNVCFDFPCGYPQREFIFRNENRRNNDKHHGDGGKEYLDTECQWYPLTY